MNSHFLLFIIMLTLTPTILIGQDNIKSKGEVSEKDISYVLTDVSYINDAIFMGRRDSIAAPYLFPSLGYYDKSGIFADASVSYLVGSEENRVDLFLLSAGYSFTGNKLQGGISGSAYFFNNNSYNVKSEVLGDITGILSYDFKFIKTSISLSSYFNKGSSADIFAGIRIDKTLYTPDQSFSINPGISLYGGSQYFYQEYYRNSRLGNRKNKGSGAGGPGTSVSNTIDIAEAEKFNLLNIELSLPMNYFHKQFIFSFQPILALPQSSATLTTETEVISEDLETVFYFSLGISYWFTTK